MNPALLPEGTTLIEIRGVYDGWSAALLPNGEILNRWTGAAGYEYQEKATDEFIAEHADKVRSTLREGEG